MKRFATAAVAAATALSLSTGAAAAQSAKTDAEYAGEVIGTALGGAVYGVSDAHEGSTETSSDVIDGSSASVQEGSAKAHLDVYGSSYERDIENEDPLGTIADIVWGVGIVAAIAAAGAAAVNAGLIPNVQLPF